MSASTSKYRREFLLSTFGLLAAIEYALLLSQDLVKPGTAYGLIGMLYVGTAALWLRPRPCMILLWLAFYLCHMHAWALSHGTFGLLWMVLIHFLTLLCLASLPNRPAHSHNDYPDWSLACHSLCRAANKSNPLVMNPDDWAQAIQREPQAALAFWQDCPADLQTRVARILGSQDGPRAPSATVQAHAAELGVATEAYLAALSSFHQSSSNRT